MGSDDLHPRRPMKISQHPCLEKRLSSEKVCTAVPVSCCRFEVWKIGGQDKYQGLNYPGFTQGIYG